MAKKRGKRPKKLHEGRSPLPQQRSEPFKDKRKKRDKKIRPEDTE